MMSFFEHHIPTSTTSQPETPSRVSLFTFEPAQSLWYMASKGGHFNQQTNSGNQGSRNNPIIHAVHTHTREAERLGSTALCGQTLGRKSIGWDAHSGQHHVKALTCKKCLKLTQAHFVGCFGFEILADTFDVTPERSQ